MASTSSSLVAEIWGRLTYRIPTSAGVLESANVKGERYVIGRAKDCDLQIGLKMISGHHCYLSKENGKVFLHDTSTNGTIVNDNRVINGQRQEIFDGDLLYLVRKKTIPERDFHLVFKTIPRALENDESGTSGVELEPKAKRLKLETVTSDTDTVIKPEECTSDEGRNNATNSVAESDTGSNENATSNVTEELVKNEEEEANAADDNPVKNEETTKVNEDVEKVVSSTSSDSNVDEILKCSLCLEIFHNPVCLQPCMHCYCAGCYSEWMQSGNDCPQCRTAVQIVAKNHMISSLVESFLNSNPHKRRSLSEIVLLDSKTTIDKQFLCHPNHPINCRCDTCVTGSSSSLSSSDSSDVWYRRVPINTCRQCPGRAKHVSVPPAAQPGSSTATQTTDYVCGPQSNHIACTCCSKDMPDRRFEPNVQPQACELCMKYFCHMYWGCTKPGCCGCLNTYSNLKYSNTNLSKLINDNVVETRILQDFVETKGKNMQNIIEECLRSLDAGTFKLAVNIKSTSVLCYKCGLSNMQTLMYKYRNTIPNGDLPDSVTSRPNCYWGLNCRTQKHNMNHAQKYNHICNQERF